MWHVPILFETLIDGITPTFLAYTPWGVQNFCFRGIMASRNQLRYVTRNKPARGRNLGLTSVVQRSPQWCQRHLVPKHVLILVDTSVDTIGRLLRIRPGVGNFGFRGARGPRDQFRWHVAPADNVPDSFWLGLRRRFRSATHLHQTLVNETSCLTSNGRSSSKRNTKAKLSRKMALCPC